MKTVCLVAILRDEEKFLDEWIIYHKILGIEHFYLYDDDPKLPLKDFLEPHKEYVTVIPWFDSKNHQNIPGRNRQTKAYVHASKNYAKEYTWVTFIDADEFIVIKSHPSIPSFLSDFNHTDQISLNWHVFGHNGYYDDPKSLITSSLTRRKFEPNRNFKSFARTSQIKDIQSAHLCRLFSEGKRVDANGKPFTPLIYPGKTEKAHINHYQCRSFLNWMGRAERGDVAIHDFKEVTGKQKWRTTKEGLLKQFVKTVALDKNEHVDEYLKKYSDQIISEIGKLNRNKDTPL